MEQGGLLGVDHNAQLVAKTQDYPEVPDKRFLRGGLDKPVV